MGWEHRPERRPVINSAQIGADALLLPRCPYLRSMSFGRCVSGADWSVSLTSAALIDRLLSLFLAGSLTAVPQGDGAECRPCLLVSLSRAAAVRAQE